jgi:hypothetical protein
MGGGIRGRPALGDLRVYYYQTYDGMNPPEIFVASGGRDEDPPEPCTDCIADTSSPITTSDTFTCQEACSPPVVNGSRAPGPHYRTVKYAYVTYPRRPAPGCTGPCSDVVQAERVGGGDTMCRPGVPRIVCPELKPSIWGG